MKNMSFINESAIKATLKSRVITVNEAQQMLSVYVVQPGHTRNLSKRGRAEKATKRLKER